MCKFQLTMSHAELSHKGKVTLINQYLTRRSGKKFSYTATVTGNEILINPAFKSQEALEHVECALLEILNNMCEEMDGRGDGCSELYNCCDCGTGNCGCAYCFSCNACDHCLNEN